MHERFPGEERYVRWGMSIGIGIVAIAMVAIPFLLSHPASSEVAFQQEPTHLVEVEGLWKADAGMWTR